MKFFFIPRRRPVVPGLPPPTVPVTAPSVPVAEPATDGPCWRVRPSSPYGCEWEVALLVEGRVWTLSRGNREEDAAMERDVIRHVCRRILCIWLASHPGQMPVGLPEQIGRIA